jgi:hypothetical protein
LILAYNHNPAYAHIVAYRLTRLSVTSEMKHAMRLRHPNIRHIIACCKCHYNTDGLLEEGAAKIIFWPMFKPAYENKGYDYIWLLDEGINACNSARYVIKGHVFQCHAIQRHVFQCILWPYKFYSSSRNAAFGSAHDQTVLIFLTVLLVE